MDELVKTMLNDIDRIKAENEKLKAENQKQKEILNRLSQTKVNHQIKNPFAFTSGLCCHHCDHKDEYIIELEEENEELKKMLKLAVEDLDFIGEYFGCAGCSAAKVGVSAHLMTVKKTVALINGDMLIKLKN